MQHVKCYVYLGGDRNHSVLLESVSVAEVVVLRALHGDDAVFGITRTEMKKTPIKDELDRLRVKYDPSGITDGGLRIVERLFPGSNPKAVPINLSDIGDFADEADEADARAQAEADAAVAAAAKKAKAKAPAKAEAAPEAPVDEAPALLE